MNKKEALRTTFYDLKTALGKNDINTLSDIVASNYTGFNFHGLFETKDDILNSLDDNDLVLTEYSAEEIDFDIIGNVGIVTGKCLIVETILGRILEHDLLFTDIFRYYEGSWKYYRSHATISYST